MSQLHFLERYTIENKEENSNHTVLKDKLNGNYVLMKEIEVSGHDDFKRMVEALEAQKQLSHQHLLSLLEYNSANQTTSEGVKRKLVSFFEYSTHRLQDEIQVRGRENRPFEQTQMWSIICSPTLGLAYLEKQNIGHGCVSVIDIFLTQQGLIKICDPAIASSSPFNFAQQYYYSPQLLSSFLEQDVSIINNLDIFKADVFSLGMIALTAGLLQDCTDCYVYNQGLVDQQLINSKLSRLSQLYSQQYVKVVAAMLQIDVDNRPNFIELQQCLIQLLSDSDQNSQVQNSFGGMKNVRFLSRPLPSIEQTQPDIQDQGDTLNPKWICNHISYENEICDINQDAQISEQQIQTKIFLKAASQSLVRDPFRISLQRSAIHDLESQSNYNYRSPRMSQFSNGTISKQTLKFQQRPSSNYQNIHMRQTYSKQNQNYQNHSNLTNYVHRNSKSIIIDNQIPLIGSRFSCATKFQNAFRPQISGFKNSIHESQDVQLFTDPVLMQIVRTDLKRIQSKPKVTFVYPTY